MNQCLAIEAELTCLETLNLKAVRVGSVVEHAVQYRFARASSCQHYARQSKVQRRSAVDVSLSMYVAIMVACVLWMFYAYVHGSVELLATNLFIFLIAIFIAILRIRFGAAGKDTDSMPSSSDRLASFSGKVSHEREDS
jgi:Flp pilus assembly protein TadB